ncbi:Na+/solute symporter [Heliocybe sulcata]|uniref:Na+/solute symporter n=1 Tax=Heliocybe sulcata TaxID=5364 RepID=A0A5C3NJN0_9AGAM|nr:Na+/solute symporter [Heliocybe sulcata]
MADNSSPAVTPALPQGAGYGICIGFGVLFGVTMYATTKVLAKFMNEVQGSEMFMTAKRSINTGLIASAVVSSWTVAATLLTSSTWAFSYGVSGAYYCAGACVQIILFSVAAIELKRKAPGAHTFLEATQVRYGVAGHWIQIFYSTLYQIFNCVNLLVGGSAVFTALTGMNVVAGCFLLPLGVVIYTLTGGIKATFLADYTHTVIIYFITLAALFTAYSRSDLIGSPDRMYELLRQAAQAAPVQGNAQGEYVTMQSLNGIILGIVIFATGWAAAVDVQLFQKAIAADPSKTMGGYLLGGLCWFAIPFCLATTFGLVGRALQSSPSFPTYPRSMSTAEINAGLAMPYAAQALMGKGGAVAVLLMMFMAVTSAFSSDLVCVASVMTYDVYRGYINPKATGGRLLKLSHFVVIAFTIVCSCIATGLSQTSIGVNFIVTSIGIICAPAVIPIACTILWRKQNTIAVVGAPILGTITGIACWLGVTSRWYGQLTVDNLGTPHSLLVGNVVALLCPIVYSPLLTYAFGPQDFDWGTLRDKIHVVDDSDVQGMTKEQLEQQREEDAMTPENNERMKRSRRIATYASIAMALGFIILFPMPMYGTHYVFSRDFFRFWVVWTFLWAWIACLIILILPIWQGRRSLSLLCSQFLFKSNASPPAPAESDSGVVEVNVLDSASMEKKA